MRQHAIPQNVLDVEFKLFTKFTVKEFVYMVTGISIGAIFIFLWTEGALPGILAFPSFLFFSGIGLILGLVPINDQPADKFVINYINAINNPTQRVWQNAHFKDKLELAAQERGLTFNKINVDPNKKDVELKKEAKIVGGIQKQEEQTESTKPKTALDLEEEEKLEKIDVLFEETGLKPKTQTQPQPQAQKAQQQTKPEPTRKIILTEENINNYAIQNANVQLNGTINLVLRNQNNQPIPGATVIIKDSFQKPILAIKSGAQGEVLSSQVLSKGEYNIDILHDQHTFPKIKFMGGNKVYPIINIKSI